MQDLLEAKEIEFDAPEIPNVITAPIPKHGCGVNTVEDNMFVSTVDELVTPLLTIKKNLLKASLFSGCDEGCHFYLSRPTSCHLLKAGVQCLMDDKEILFKKTPVLTVSYKDVSIITISANPSRVSTKIPVRITLVPKVSPLIITMPGPIPYSSDKTVPWNYGGDVYYHGVKQDWLADEDSIFEKADPTLATLREPAK